jgi:hypothetical protein
MISQKAQKEIATKRHKKHKRRAFIQISFFVIFVPFCGDVY